MIRTHQRASSFVARGLTIVVALALMLLPIAALQGQVIAAASPLDLTPAGAPIVVYIPSLAGLNQKVASLNQAMGLNAPEMDDLLSAFKQGTGMVQGVDDSGTLLLILTDIQALADGAGDPPVLMLVPITDYPTFLKNFPQAQGQEIDQVVMPDGTPGFIKSAGTHAIIGASRGEVENYQPGPDAAQATLAAVGPAGAKCLADADAAVIVNVQAIAPVIQAKIDEAIAEVQMLSQMAPTGEAAMFESVVQIYSVLINNWVRDTSAVVLALDMNDQGVGATLTSQFMAGSEMAQLFSDSQGASDTLNRLPNESYLFATSMNFAGLHFGELLDMCIQAVGQDDTEGNMLLDMVKAWRPLLDMSVSSAGSFNLMPMMGAMGMMGGNPFTGLSVTETTDGPAYLAATKASYEALGKLEISVPGPVDPQQPTTQPEVIRFLSEYQSDVMQVDGISVDSFSLQMQPPASAMGPGQGPMPPMQEGYIAAKGNFVVMTLSRDVELLRRGLMAADQTNGLGTDPLIQAVRQQGLPADSATEVYISVATIADMGNMFMAMMMMPPMDVPADLPPIGIGAALKDGGLIERTYIPMPVLTFIGDTIAHIQALQQGAGSQGDPQWDQDNGEQNDQGDQEQNPDAPSAPF